MKSMILDGILVQLDGIKCDANILDPVLKREMIISVTTIIHVFNLLISFIL